MSDEDKPSVYNQPGWQVEEVNQTVVNNNQTVINTYNTQIAGVNQPAASLGQQTISTAAKITYKPFTVAITPLQDGYLTQVLDSPMGQAENVIKEGFSVEELVALKGQRIAGQAPLSPQAAGQQIFECFFVGQVESCYRRSLDGLKASEGLRINLRLDQTPELADLPWEALYDPESQSFLALSLRTPLVRYMPLALPEAHLPVAPPLVMLVLIANPQDRQPALNVDDEWKRIQAALHPLLSKGQVVLERSSSATIEGLQDRLRKGDVHVLHYIGHADFDLDLRTGHLILEDENGNSRPVSAEHLRVVLTDQKALRLAFLNACEGAQGGGEDSYAGIAQALVQAGVPAVIGMRQTVGDGVAALLAGEFYEAVSDGYPIDAALAEARKSVFLKDDTLSWGLPVLFSRSPDNRLIELPAVPLPLPPTRLPPLVQRFLLPGLVLVVLASLAITAVLLPADNRFGWIQANIEQNKCRSQIEGACIVLARLAPGSGEASRNVTQLLASSLVNARKNYKYNVVYTRPAQNRQDALALARRYAAPLIVWGDIVERNELNATVHLEVVDRLGIAQAADMEPFRLQHFPVDSASITADIPCEGELDCLGTKSGQMVKSAPVVARLAIGLSSYSLRDVKAVRAEMEPLANCILTPAEPKCDEQYLLPYLDDQTRSLILYYVGQVYRMQQDPVGALVYLNEARKLAPENPALSIITGIAYQEWSGFPLPPEAAAAFTQAQQQLGSTCLVNDENEHAGERLYSLGVIYELQQQWSEAEKCYRLAVEALAAQGSDQYSTLINLARVQQASGQKDSAFATLSQAKTLAPDLPWAELELAQLTIESESESRVHLDKAVDMAPTVMQVYIAKAELCTVWGNIECATEAYNRTRSLRPDYAWVVVKMGEFYQLQEEWAESQKYLELAIDLGAKSPWVYERLGFVLRMQEEWQEAADMWRQAIQRAYSDESVQHLFCQESAFLAFLEQDEVEFLQNCVKWTANENERTWAEQRLQVIAP